MGFTPAHKSAAEHDVAVGELHVSVVGLPSTTLEGFAVKVIAGPDGPSVKGHVGNNCKR